MTLDKKKEVTDGVRLISNIMSIVGFPILIGIGVKTYNRAEADHDVLIKLIGDHNHLEKDLDKLTEQHNTMRDYVYRGSPMATTHPKIQIDPSEN